MLVLFIQENGRHEKNRNFRECFCTKRALEHHGHEAHVWGLGHDNYETEPDYESYDLIINLENYDETGWVPNLSKVQTKKFLWSIDAHVKGIRPYIKTANEGNYDLILQATPEFCDSNSVWFPNCYDDEVIKPLDVPKTHDVGFCGNAVNRGQLIQTLSQNFNFKFDEFVIGDDMVRAINSYKVHWNANIGVDINYRNFETMGCGTLLVTSHNPHYKSLGMVDGVNCLVYTDIKQMLEKVRFSLDNDEFRTTISNKGFVLAQEHTYKKRVEHLLNLLRRF